MEDSNHTIRNRTHDLPACSTVPQPTAPLRVPLNIVPRSFPETSITRYQSMLRNIAKEGSSDAHRG
jgi:hypothetical protein